MHFQQILQPFIIVPKINSHTVDKLVKNSLIFLRFMENVFLCAYATKRYVMHFKKFLPAWLTVWYMPAIFGYIGFDNDFTHP